MEFPDRAALDAYLKNEPYVIEGVRPYTMMLCFLLS